jgi:hypothetical protein
MIYLTAIVFPILTIVAGLATLFALVKFIAQIRREFKEPEH